MRIIALSDSVSAARSAARSAAFAPEFSHDGSPCFEVECTFLSTGKTDDNFSTLIIPHLSITTLLPTRMCIDHSVTIRIIPGEVPTHYQHTAIGVDIKTSLFAPRSECIQAERCGECV